MNEQNHYAPSFFEISLRQLNKNKLAVWSLITILFLFFVAIYAPLLSNNKPLLLYAPFPEEYEDTYYVVLSNIDIYVKNLNELHTHYTDKIQHQLNQYHGYILRAVKKLKTHLDSQHLTDFEPLERNLSLAIKQENVEQIQKIVSAIKSDFSPDHIRPRYLVRFPAIRNLTVLQIFLMVCYPLFVCLVLLKNIFRSKYDRIKVKKGLLSSLLISLCAAVLWSYCIPVVFDPTDYKKLVKQMPEDARVLFTPIPYGENENISPDASQKPTWLLQPNSRSAHYHILGTDTNGRDVLCRMVWGTRISMSVGFIAVGLCLVIGLLFGALAGYFRGWMDITISRIIELVICFPVFFLILTVLAFLRPSIVNIMVVIGITGWTGIARLCRGEFLKLVKQDFVVAAHALGTSHLRVIFKHILPNALGPVLVAVSFGIAGAILTESALSFLGFGVPQPTASWGDLLNNGRNDIQGTWWLTVFPGMAIFIAVTAFNLAGEGLRDALDPRLKRL